MANSSSNSSRITAGPTSTSSLTTTTQLTTTTAGSENPVPSTPLHRDALLQVVARIDSFNTLAAMASTSRDWNLQLHEAFECLQKLSQVKDATVGAESYNRLEQFFGSKTLSFALGGLLPVC